MRSQNTRTVVFFFLICLSIASYAYVNLVDREVSSEVSGEVTEQVDEFNEESDDVNAVHLPDVRMLRTAIEAGKRILPAS